MKPKIVPWRRLPLPYQFFGRIRRAELACPACGTVHVLFARSAHWDPLRSRFKCKDCGRQYDIGLLAWPTMGPRRGPAIDTVLTPRKTPGFQGSLYSRLTSLLRGSSFQPINHAADVPAEPPAGFRAPQLTPEQEIPESWDPRRSPDPGEEQVE